MSRLRLASGHVTFWIAIAILTITLTTMSASRTSFGESSEKSIEPPTKDDILSLPFHERRGLLLSQFGNNFLIVNGSVYSTFDTGVLNAVMKQDENALTAATEKGFDVNSPIESGSVKGMTLLHFAVDVSPKNSTTTLEFLFKKGANPNATFDRKPFTKWTAVSLAAFRDSEPMLRELTAAGADATPRDGASHTPLDIATATGSPRVVSALLAMGVAPSADPIGFTPLHQAARMAFPEENDRAVQLTIQEYIVRLLLANGAAVNADATDGGKPGKKPIHMFSEKGPVAIIKLIWQAGGDINAEFDGKTPLDLALANNNADVAQFLRSVGGKSRLQ